LSPFSLQDDPIAGSTDGVWQGYRYFFSRPGRGIFLPVANVQLRPANAVSPEKSVFIIAT